MNTTEKLSAIRARCVELIEAYATRPDYNLCHRAPDGAVLVFACRKAPVAGWRATIAAIDSIESPDGLDYHLSKAIITAWEGVI